MIRSGLKFLHISSSKYLLHWREREMFYLTTHSTHFIYGYMVSDIWLRTILIVRKETRCCHIGYSYRLTARVLLYAPSHRQDNTYHGLCYTSRGALAGMRNIYIENSKWLHFLKIRRSIKTLTPHDTNLVSSKLTKQPNRSLWYKRYVVNHKAVRYWVHISASAWTQSWVFLKAKWVGVRPPHPLLPN